MISTFSGLTKHRFSVKVISVSQDRRVAQVINATRFHPSLVSVQRGNGPLLDGGLFRLFFLTAANGYFCTVRVASMFVNLIHVGFVVVREYLSAFRVGNFNYFVRR